VWARRLKAVTSHRTPKCYAREFSPSCIKASATLKKSRISPLKGVSYRFRDLCWTRARTAASKRAKSVEP
jgi:hypothetical protein